MSIIIWSQITCTFAYGAQIWKFNRRYFLLYFYIFDFFWCIVIIGDFDIFDGGWFLALNVCRRDENKNN